MSSSRITVHTQIELNAALEAAVEHQTQIVIESPHGARLVVHTNKCIHVEARENSSVVAWENSSVVAWENSSVVAWGNSSVVARENSSVVAWGNSSVEAWENSSVVARENSSVEARENSSVEARGNSSVEAWGNSSVVAWGNSSVVAWGPVQIRTFHTVKITTHHSYTVISNHSPAAQITGPATVVPIPPIRIAADWIAAYGACSSKEDAEVVILYKAVRDDCRSSHGFLYAPGTVPQAPDWDGGIAECGGGLHFCATPLDALGFDGQATRFMACPVRISDIVVHENPAYPSKVKAPGLCAPCWEVDRRGKRLEQQAQQRALVEQKAVAHGE